MFKSNTFAPYGPEHHPIVTTLAGERLSSAQVVDTCVYLTPHYRTFKTTDGRYLQLVEQAEGDVIFEFADASQWQAWRKQWFDDFPKHYLR